MKVRSGAKAKEDDECLPGWRELLCEKGAIIRSLLKKASLTGDYDTITVQAEIFHFSKIYGLYYKD